LLRQPKSAVIIDICECIRTHIHICTRTYKKARKLQDNSIVEAEKVSILYRHVCMNTYIPKYTYESARQLHESTDVEAEEVGSQYAYVCIHKYIW